MIEDIIARLIVTALLAGFVILRAFCEKWEETEEQYPPYPIKQKSDEKRRA